MTKELYEQIRIVTANQGTPTGMGLPLTDEYIGYVIKLVTQANKEAVKKYHKECRVKGVIPSEEGQIKSLEVR